MIKLKYKFLLYKIYNQDIWGDLKTHLERSYRKKKRRVFYKNRKLYFSLNSLWPYTSKFEMKIVNFFYSKFLNWLTNLYEKSVTYTYGLDNFVERKKKKKRYKQILTFKLNLLYYVNLSHIHLKKMAIKAKSQKGFFDQNFLLLLEGRLVCLVYRTGLILNMFDSISFIKKGCVKVDNLLISDLNYSISIMQIVGFRGICKGYLFLNFWRLLLRKVIFQYQPKFIYFFYNFFFFFLKRHIKKKDLILPYNFDIFRAIGYGGYAK